MNDILEMAKPEINKRALIVSVIEKMRELKKNGMNNAEIENVIRDLQLPIALHLYITGNFSKLMKYGIDFKKYAFLYK